MGHLWVWQARRGSSAPLPHIISSCFESTDAFATDTTCDHEFQSFRMWWIKKKKKVLFFTLKFRLMPSNFKVSEDIQWLSPFQHDAQSNFIIIPLFSVISSQNWQILVYFLNKSCSIPLIIIFAPMVSAGYNASFSEMGVKEAGTRTACRTQEVDALQIYRSGNEGFCSIPYFCLSNSHDSHFASLTTMNHSCFVLSSGISPLWLASCLLMNSGRKDTDSTPPCLEHCPRCVSSGPWGEFGCLEMLVSQQLALPFTRCVSGTLATAVCGR